MNALIGLFAIAVLKTLWLWAMVLLYSAGIAIAIQDWAVKLWSRRS